MGSLMAGWSSEVLDPETVLWRRNKSLTKEEIDSFRRLSKEDNDELHTPSTSPKSPYTAQEAKKEAAWQQVLPGGSNKTLTPGTLEHQAEPDKPTEKLGDWWTKSKWAYLNEPPRDHTNDSALKYTAQFQVADLATNKA